jgi:hypothetical protein
MIVQVKPIRHKKSLPSWHSEFVAMLPVIKTQAKFAFRHLDPESRAEMVQEVICNCCCAFVRLLELGKADVVYPTVLARLGIAQVKAGRKVGGQLNCHDVLSQYCQQRKNIFIKRLDSYDTKADAWQEVVVEDKHAGPAEVAATRIDFAAWLKLMPRRLQKMVNFLAAGESTLAAAKKFRVTEGRISQIRKELHNAWHCFQKDELALATA